MAFYKKRIARQDKPEDVAERIAYREAFERANAETFTRFPTITADNFQAACEFKQQRINEIMGRST